jgi:ABC-2 type transport system ATP-binding protein
MGGTAMVNEAGSSAKVAVPVVRVSGFVKKYRQNAAVHNLDLEIHTGEIYGLIGPDGAGKSSLIKAMAGVLSFEGGTVNLFGTNIDSEKAAETVKPRIGFMPQGLGLNLYPNLSVEENINFFASLRLVPADKLASRKQNLLSITRLDRFKDRPMKNLSGGMKQKLGLVCTLIHEPELIILDEPTTGVDPVSRRDFWTILTDLLREQGITALISTAYMDEATRFHRMSLMFEGEVLAGGEPDDILNLVPGTVVSLHADSQARALSELKEHFLQVESLGAMLRVFVENKSPSAAVQAVKAAVDGIEIKDVQSADPELEDVFVALLHQRHLADNAPDPLQDVFSGPAALYPVTLTPESVTPETLKPEAVGNAIAIKAEALSKQFGDFCAVDKISFHVRQGEIFGLLGANGAGKTTAIKMLNGILTPTSGFGRVAGVDMCRAGKDVKNRIGYMSQLFSLYQDLTVIENIRLYCGIYGLSRPETKERIAWVIHMAGLSGYEKKLAGRLPMGVGQRLALGCALVHHPRVLFLDEPTSGVDPVGRRRFWDILFKLSREDGVTIMLTTHYMSESEHCDRLALMYAGRIVADAPPLAMKQSLQNDAGHLLDVLTGQPLIALKKLEESGFDGVALFSKHIHLLSKNPTAAEEKIRSILGRVRVDVLDIAQRPLSMEDVFVYRVLELEKEEKGRVS